MLIFFHPSRVFAEKTYQFHQLMKRCSSSFEKRKHLSLSNVSSQEIRNNGQYLNFVFLFYPVSKMVHFFSSFPSVCGIRTRNSLFVYYLVFFKRLARRIDTHARLGCSLT